MSARQSKRFADPVARRTSIAAAGLVARVALLVLEVAVRRDERLLEEVLEEAQALVVAGVALAAGEEAVRAPLVAVHVEEDVHPRALHRGAHVEDLGARLLGRVVPGAVQVLADGVGAQVAEHAAVGVHAGHDVEDGARARLPGDRIVGIEQPLEQALGEPLRHRLAGVLAREDPDAEALAVVLAADHDHLERAPLDGLAERRHGGEGRRGRALISAWCRVHGYAAK